MLEKFCHYTVRDFVRTPSAPSFFSVADDNAAANMKDVFSGIAQKILQAAKDVTVEDQIAPEYTMIFDFPNNYAKTELGSGQEFYISKLEATPRKNSTVEKEGTPE